MECPFELPVTKISQSEKLRIFRVITANQKAVAEILTSDEADYIVQAINSHEKLVKHIEALKSVCETYIPTDKMDEANDKVILLCMGNVEEIGRKLIAKQALKEAEK